MDFIIINSIIVIQYSITLVITLTYIKDHIMNDNKNNN